MSIYEGYYDTIIQVMEYIAHQIEANSRRYEAEHGDKLYEHLIYRIKGDDSMRDKLVKHGLEPNTYNALRKVTDSICLRVVCLFIDDVYENAALLKSLPGCTVVQEKDYIRDAKPNSEKSGFGIGLSMAKEIADRMKGKLRVKYSGDTISFTVEV